MNITTSLFILGLAVCLAAGIGAAFAADPVDKSDVPEPWVENDEGPGIWGAIAYSPADRKMGAYWGGDTRSEAEEHALRYCRNATGSDCRLIETFRNHRHWNDDDGAYPYNQCAALAVDKNSDKWGSDTAKSMKDARSSAKAKCSEETCQIIEQGCT